MKMSFKDCSDYEQVIVRKSQMPPGSELMECYRTENEIIVCGDPDPDDMDHNCDVMGCSNVNHVLYRFKIAQQRK